MLGLGDSSYTKYNYCSRILIEKLKELGSVVVIKEFSNSQDMNGMYDGYNRFIKELDEIISDEPNPTVDDNTINYKSNMNNDTNRDSSNSINTDMNNNIINTSNINSTNTDINNSNSINIYINNEIIINNSNYINTDINNYIVKSRKFNAKVLSNTLITPIVYPCKIYELALSIPEYTSFTPGDCISILPTNATDLSQFF